MDSLANYGSDDDYDDSSDEQQKDYRQVEYNKDTQPRQARSENQADANYEEVQMDLSEESNDGSRNSRDNKEGSGEDRRRNSPTNIRSRETQRSRRGEDRYRESSRSRDRKDEDRTRERKDDRYSSKSDRYSRDYRRDGYRDRKSRRSSSRERRSSHSRDRKRSSSRERRYSRSPKGGRSRRSRSRSRSRGRYGGPPRRYGYPKNNGSRNETSETAADNQGGNKDRFFMPGITGKYRDQIEKRKLLWQKKEPQKQEEVDPRQGQSTAAPPSTSRGTKIWEATTFAQDQDGKVASKFKRLMGIKGQSDTAPVPPVDIIKKQEEMFSSMEQQYEVARTATHTMRGVGLGFSSNYPR